MQKLPEAAFHPLTEVDALVSLDELTLESVALVERLAPFGQENPQPTFLARNVTLVNTRRWARPRTTSPAHSPMGAHRWPASCSTAPPSTRCS